jgi:6-phosphogluconolactonase (cycloisomerase 2 family)
MIYTASDDQYVTAFQLHPSGWLEEKQSIENVRIADGMKCGAPGGVSTEWIVVHPKQPVVYAMTSYWHKREAKIVTYGIDRATGLLTRLGAVNSGGLQAAEAVFSKNGRYLLVAHYVSGEISIFDTFADARVPNSPYDSPLGPPMQVVQLPAKRRKTKKYGKHSGGNALAHGIRMSPDGKKFTVCNAGEDVVHVYAFDEGKGSAELVQNISTTGAVRLPHSTTLLWAVNKVYICVYIVGLAFELSFYTPQPVMGVLLPHVSKHDNTYKRNLIRDAGLLKRLDAATSFRMAPKRSLPVRAT